MIYDVSALLWVINWPTGHSLKTYINGFKAYVYQALQVSNVTLVFDRYYASSIKTGARLQRAKSSRVCHLTLEISLPARDIVLSSIKNKVQLNNLIAECLCDRQYGMNTTQHHLLVLAGIEDVPMDIFKGVCIARPDIQSSHEEADNIIVQHAIGASLLIKPVKVVCDDTDVFVLLVHFYNRYCTDVSAPMIMCSPVHGRTVIDVKASAALQHEIANDLPAIHALSGSDSTASLHGIGKATLVKVAKEKHLSLNMMGDTNVNFDTVLQQATRFMSAAYGKGTVGCTSMTDCRLKLWKSKTSKAGASSIKLCSLPPTTEAFTENVRRCHLQVAIWKAALDDAPPSMDPCENGWEFNHENILIPHTVPTGTVLTLVEVFK